MAMDVEFFWDPGSTNTYFAWHLVRPIVAKHGATLVMQPFNLGYVFRHHHYALTDEPAAKMRNRKRDLERWARRYGLPFRVNDVFPIKTSRILRGAIASRAFDREFAFIDEVMRRYWERNDASVASDAGLREVAVAIGVDADAFMASLAADDTGETVARVTQDGLDRGVFGAPTFVIDGEIYWGKDRIEFVEHHLATGRPY